MGVLNGGEIQMAAPDKGAQRAQEGIPYGNIPRTGARLDIGGTLPRPAQALVIPLGGQQAHADGCDCRIGAQAQIGAEHIAVARDVIQDSRHRAGGLDQPRTGLLKIIRAIATFIKQADQINVGGIVQLSSTHLAHRQHGHAPCGFCILGREARQLAAPDLRAHSHPKCCMCRRIRIVRQRACHLLQRPRPAQISQGR